MATEFTKGPWYVMDTPLMREMFNGCSVVVSQHVDDAIIATIAEDVHGCKANGQLLAAAPDLLQACKEAAALLEEMGHKDLVTAIDLRAVIRKAEATNV